jgi:hypothetical protein
MNPSSRSIGRPLSVLAAVLAALFLVSCVGDTVLTDTERAAKIKEKRLEARDMFARYQASDGENIEFLKKKVELHRETTEIAPATCPRCWAEYGEALSMMGYYYWFQYNRVLKEIDSVKKGAQTDDLQAEAEEYRKEWMRYFGESNRAYETHFRSRDVTTIHPWSYERVMRHNELLGKYDRALYYLEQYVAAYPIIGPMDEQGRQKVEKLRRLYRTAAQREKAKAITGDDSLPPPPVSAGGAAPRKPTAKRPIEEEE